MDKIFSARLDEAALDEMERVTRRLKMTKRKFLEEAIHFRAQQLGEGSQDVWNDTSGVWRRKEPVEKTIRSAREEFRRTFERRHTGKRARVHR